MYSTDPEIQRQSENVRAALLVYFERNPDMKSPYDGMCYVASATLKKLVGNKVRLWKTRDQNNQFHWWCETRNGETILWPVILRFGSLVLSICRSINRTLI